MNWASGRNRTADVMATCASCPRRPTSIASSRAPETASASKRRTYRGGSCRRRAGRGALGRRRWRRPASAPGRARSPGTPTAGRRGPGHGRAQRVGHHRQGVALTAEVQPERDRQGVGDGDPLGVVVRLQSQVPEEGGGLVRPTTIAVSARTSPASTASAGRARRGRGARPGRGRGRGRRGGRRRSAGRDRRAARHRGATSPPGPGRRDAASRLRPPRRRRRRGCGAAAAPAWRPGPRRRTAGGRAHQQGAAVLDHVDDAGDLEPLEDVEVHQRGQLVQRHPVGHGHNVDRRPGGAIERGETGLDQFDQPRRRARRTAQAPHAVLVVERAGGHGVEHQFPQIEQISRLASHRRCCVAPSTGSPSTSASSSPFASGQGRARCGSSTQRSRSRRRRRGPSPRIARSPGVGTPRRPPPGAPAPPNRHRAVGRRRRRGRAVALHPRCRASAGRGRGSRPRRRRPCGRSARTRSHRTGTPRRPGPDKHADVHAASAGRRPPAAAATCRRPRRRR